MTHVPVLLEPALELLAIRSDGIYVDATFGGGGHANAILRRLTTGRLVVLDADPAARVRADAIGDSRLTFVHANFRNLADALDRCGVALVDGVLFDLGVSSMQFDDAQRGFSLNKSAPLDMRMDPDQGRSAYDVLATASEVELAEIFFTFGEERSARRIAHAIVERREAGELPATTTEFASLVSGVVHRPGRRERVHPATRVFQALRIAVNDELDALRDGLNAAIDRLRCAGRVVAISFHSLEDRIVKHAFRNDARLDVLTKKPLRPDVREVEQNSRARSAKLRAARRRAS
ncbi:MAG: 16S rRNA (cytosine(1402)-N(4))-methyltransferase RsmH [Candidatus Eremiobacteraeota bacterium]|nr:16S rRNA (cytosine(1402)-N(4))-methyltransferase RsmH [Candidatus Eremiobacteraeota bacterium]